MKAKATEFIKLTELWQEGKYSEVAEIIFQEDWDNSKTAEFCAYFAKYLGLKELDILWRML